MEDDRNTHILVYNGVKRSASNIWECRSRGRIQFEERPSRLFKRFLVEKVLSKL